MPTQAKVSASFRLANWGIPGAAAFSALGTPVPAGCDPLNGGAQCAGVNNNPTPETPINAGLSGDYQTTWALHYKQSCFYKMREHQCIHVDMDSNDPGTRFLNKSVERNMDFVPASTFSQTAYINGNQGPLPSGRTAHRFLLQLDLDQDGPLRGAADRGHSRGRGRRWQTDHALQRSNTDRAGTQRVQPCHEYVPVDSSRLCLYRHQNRDQRPRI